MTSRQPSLLPIPPEDERERRHQLRKQHGTSNEGTAPAVGASGDRQGRSANVANCARNALDMKGPTYPTRMASRKRTKKKRLMLVKRRKVRRLVTSFSMCVERVEAGVV